MSSVFKMFSFFSASCTTSLEVVKGEIVRNIVLFLTPARCSVEIYK